MDELWYVFAMAGCRRQLTAAVRRDCATVDSMVSCAVVDVVD